MSNAEFAHRCALVVYASGVVIAISAVVVLGCGIAMWRTNRQTNATLDEVERVLRG